MLKLVLIVVLLGLGALVGGWVFLGCVFLSGCVVMS